MKFYLPFITLCFLAFSSCKNEVSQDSSASNKAIFEELPSTHTAITFSNIITETEENNHLVWESIYNGAGVGVGDINNDGLQDIYFTSNMGEDKLYLNKGNFQFEDITASSKIKENDWSSGVVFADVNNDGLVDIYVSKMSWYRDNEHPELRANRLYINNGDLTFTEKAKEYGIADIGHTTQSSFFDYNKDGLLDLYVMNAPSHRYDQKLQYIKSNSIPYEFKDHLYLNHGDHFEDVTVKALGDLGHAFGLGLVTLDLDQDGWTDIYVANDFEKPDLMLINDHNGKFTNKLQEKLKHISYSSMGMDAADINNDTLYDIAVLDMQSSDHVRSKTNMPSMNIPQFWDNVANGYYFQFMSNMVQINNGKGYYSEVGQLTGMASTDWSWSILLADIDNDSYRDALVTNGINRNIKDNDFNTLMRNSKKDKDFSFLKMAMKTKVEKVANYAFKNNNGDLSFVDVSDQWAFNHSGFSYGAAYADLDNDGDLDVVVSNSNEQASIYKNNNVNDNHFLRVQMRDGNHIVLNSRATIYYGDKYQNAEQHNVRGYQSCSESIMHFGLGNIETIDSIVCTYPDGKMVVIKNPKINTMIMVDYKDAEFTHHIDISNPSYITDISSQSGILYRHAEDNYNDFDNQILIPHMETKNGPFTAVADLNADGMEDLYIGAAKNDFSVIYMQGKDGQMHYFENKDLISDKAFEDMGAVFFDVDNDHDQDLYVVSGGSEEKEGSALYQDRLYINAGNGQFTKSSQILPTSNGSNVMTIDMNNDGYMDLFVGGRMEGAKYPYPGTSHLLINFKGELKEDRSFAYKNLGMVTASVAMDINKDGWQDMIVVGEWMQPTFLINEKGVFKDMTNQYLPEKHVGWWFSIVHGDIDGDGIDEILLGNIGMNNKYKASEHKPIKVYGADFDNNHKFDIVLSKNTKYGEVPVRGFECSSQQLPELKQKFDSYNSFAHAHVDQLIDVDKQKTLILGANDFRSGYLKWANNKYEFHPFPNQAQISAINAMQIADIDKDGRKDIIICGNLFDAEVETTRHDSSVGLVIRNTKNGLVAMSPNESGFYAPGNAKDLKSIKLNGKPSFIVTNNSFGVQVYRIESR